MSTYDPNPATTGPVGYQPVEFLESDLSSSIVGIPSLGKARGLGAPLNERVLADLTSSARQYIASLVASYDGDGDDLRSVIDGLGGGEPAPPSSPRSSPPHRS